MKVKPFLLFSTVLSASFVVSSVSHAGVYKCSVAGKTTYQATPCAANSTQKKMGMSDQSQGMPWHGLRRGMSVKQVQQQVKSQTSSKDRVVSGASAKVTKDKVRVAGVSFSAKYFFLNERLTQINLSNDFAENQKNIKSYKSLAAFYTARLGKPTVNKNKSGKFGASMDMKWQTKRGKVWLSVMPVTAEVSMLLTGIKLN